MYFWYDSYRSSDGGHYCPKRNTDAATKSRNTSHFVVTWEPGSPNTVTLYTDGTLDSVKTTVGSGTTKGNLPLADLWAHWSTGHRLQLFGDTRNQSSSGIPESAPWNGNLYGLAMYRTALTAAEVLQNYNARLPDSPPSVTTFSATVNEDGMPQDYRKDPSKYNGATSVPALELEWVALTAADQDEEASYPNYNATDQRVRPMAVFLSSLPAKARLYQFVSGAEITATPAEVPPSYEDSSGSVYDAAAAMALSSSVALTKTYRVRVRPDKDQYSDMVSCEPVACLLRRLSFPLARWQHPSRPTRARRTPAAGT